jgi:hypothetical protein
MGRRLSDSGANPMRPAGADDDTVSMTVLAHTYDSRLGRFGRRRDGDQVSGRPADPGRDDHPMDLSREMQMQELRERIERNAYDVDAQAVADAIVARLLTAGRREQPSGEPRP